MFLDNLKMHHNGDVAVFAKKRGIRFMFNASYSPVFNGGVEGLWALAKRNFARHCINQTNFDDQEFIVDLVRQSILSVPSSYLVNCIARQFSEIKNELT
jgi:transposase